MSRPCSVFEFLAGQREDGSPLADARPQEPAAPWYYYQATLFTVTDPDEPERVETYTLREMLRENQDDLGFVQWLLDCKMGDTFPTLAGMVECVGDLRSREPIPAPEVAL